MEAVLMPYSRNQTQPIAPYTQIRNQKRNNDPMNGALISGFSENFAPPSNIYGGHFLGPIYNHPIHHTQIQMNPRQPPLLPLPISRTYSSVPSRGRANRIKKPKQPVKRREDPKQAQPVSGSGPGPKDLPRVMLASDLDKFSGSVFTLSPPPSSFPLPKFRLRPKLGCKAEAGGVDAGATDNLRQMLRLR